MESHGHQFRSRKKTGHITIKPFSNRHAKQKILCTTQSVKKQHIYQSPQSPRSRCHHSDACSEATTLVTRRRTLAREIRGTRCRNGRPPRQHVMKIYNETHHETVVTNIKTKHFPANNAHLRVNSPTTKKHGETAERNKKRHKTKTHHERIVSSVSSWIWMEPRRGKRKPRDSKP